MTIFIKYISIIIENDFQSHIYLLFIEGVSVMGVIQTVTSYCEKKFIKYPLLFKIYSYPYKYILKREIKLGQITENDRVLNIGCGAIPYSAVYISRMTGARVEAIDYDAHACIKARKYIKRLNLKSKITIKRGNGIEYDIDSFDVILVALQAEPKKEILDNLFEKAETGTRFIFRKPRKIVENQYDKLPADYPVSDDIAQPMLTFNKSVLYVKE